jgi:hypothetical protein
VLAACGGVASPAIDAAAPDAATDAALDAATDAPAITDRTCAEVKAHLGTATDGVYSIDPDGLGVNYKPFQVFCAGMASATPKEYLELKRTTVPPAALTSNYGTYVTSADHGDLMCDCGALKMVFSKVRINPVTLVVDTEDRTLAVFTDSTQATCWQNTPGCHTNTFVIEPSYAIARACVVEGDTSGRANVDLRDMPFHVAGTDTAMFGPVPFAGAGTVTIDAERKQVSLTGGGNCGGFGAGAGLELAQDF